MADRATCQFLNMKKTGQVFSHLFLHVSSPAPLRLLTSLKPRPSQARPRPRPRPRPRITLLLAPSQPLHWSHPHFTSTEFVVNFCDRICFGFDHQQCIVTTIVHPSRIIRGCPHIMSANWDVFKSPTQPNPTSCVCTEQKYEQHNITCAYLHLICVLFQTSILVYSLRYSKPQNRV